MIVTFSMFRQRGDDGELDVSCYNQNPLLGVRPEGWDGLVYYLFSLCLTRCESGSAYPRHYF